MPPWSYLFIAQPEDSLLYTSQYDPVLVVLSCAIAFFAAYASLLIAQRAVVQVRMVSRWLWLGLSGMSLGLGIWSMHFVGMIALSLPCATSYDPELTLLSMLPAIAACSLALALITREKLSPIALVLGGVLLGLGIVGMHFSGMAALRLDGLVRYNLQWVLLAGLWAVLLATLAIWLNRRLRVLSAHRRRFGKALTAAVLSLAIAAMHYTAMASAYFLRGPGEEPAASDYSVTSLAYLTLIVTAVVILLAVAANLTVGSGLRIFKNIYRQIAALIIAWCGLTWLGVSYYHDEYVSNTLQQRQQLAQLTLENLVNDIDRRARDIKGIALIYASHQDVMHALREYKPGSSAIPAPRQIKLNQNLRDLASHMGVDAVWIVSPTGEIIAASNFDQPDNPIGTRLAERHRLLLTQHGAAYRLGIEDKKADLIYTHPVEEGGKAIGQVLVKRSISGAPPLDEQKFFATDAEGLVIYSPDQRLLRRVLPPLPGQGLQATLQQIPSSSKLPPIQLEAWPDARLPGTLRIEEWPMPSVLVSAKAVDGLLTLHLAQQMLDLGRLQIEENWLILLIASTGSMLILALTAILLWQRESNQISDDLRIAAIAFETQGMMMITDPDRMIIRANQALLRFTGYPSSKTIGRRADVLQSDRIHEAQIESPWNVAEKTGSWQGEFWLQRQNGETSPTWLTLNAVHDSLNRITHFVGMLIDISKLKSAEEQVKELAYYDPLTKLPNRRMLIDRLRKALAHSLRTGRLGVLIFIDLDNFKFINDSLGHDKGDLLLCEVAHRLQAIVREGDTVARLSGDEFVVMLEGLHLEPEKVAQDARVVGDKFLASLSIPYQLAGYSAHSSASIGVALFGEKQDTIEAILKRADLAMYQSKAAGRNALHFFDPNMQAAVDTRAALELDLRAAIDREQLQLYYQIQVDETGQITGVEALIRWNHPERGLLLPDAFISIAEEIGLIVPIGEWVLKTACLQLVEWSLLPEANNLRLAVNISPRQFHHPDFVERVKSIIRETGANPRLLELEITEGLLLLDIEDTISKMEKLKQSELGIGFTLDDFGIGYSSLAYLQRLPLDQLKIDRSFLVNIFMNKNDAAIVRSIIALAHSMSLKVVAEGVETKPQRDFLHKLGCTSCQGYYFGEPKVAKDLPFIPKTTGA
ncbi:MAG: bifunctional diguanylate cyclase/phosphodiesterase [Hylemonella sp.]